MIENYRWPFNVVQLLLGNQKPFDTSNTSSPRKHIKPKQIYIYLVTWIRNKRNSSHQSFSPQQPQMTKAENNFKTNSTDNERLYNWDSGTWDCSLSWSITKNNRFNRNWQRIRITFLKADPTIRWLYIAPGECSIEGLEKYQITEKKKFSQL